MNGPGPKKHRGVALITILLIVVIATVLATAMTTQQQFAINRAQTFLDQGIVRQYAYGGEELARQILYQDFEESQETDHLAEIWAARDLQFEFEEGEVQLLIEDLGGRLNLNSVFAQDAVGQQAARQRLAELFNLVGADPAMLDRLIDWVDTDEANQPMGSEDFDYLGLERPYRAANQPLLHTSGLRLLLGMSAEQYAALEPYVTALPDPDVVVNINTAPPTVLQALAPGLSLADAQSIVELRDLENPYASVSDFTGDPALSGAAQNINTAGLGVQSVFFQVQVRARYQDRFGYLTSIIQRDPTDGSLRVIYRDLSKKILAGAGP